MAVVDTTVPILRNPYKSGEGVIKIRALVVNQYLFIKYKYPEYFIDQRCASV